MASPRQAPGGTIRLPLDHFSSQRTSPAIGVPYEWGAPYRADRPTVLLVADAQQFYLRQGTASELQSKLFGENLNVLAFFGRASSPELRRYVRPEATTDWSRAARALNIHQWIADLRSTVETLQIPVNRLTLYGRSGGADLVLRFLAVHPNRAARAYVQAAVTHDLAAHWGLTADHFWEDLTARHPDAAARLAAFLAAHTQSRREAILLLQRQNFYEPLDRLESARLALIEAVLRQDESRLADFRRQYQLDSLLQLQAAGQHFSAVRVHEFTRPYGDPRGRPPPLRPDIEAAFYYSEPVTREIYDGQVHRPYPNLEGLRSSATEVLIVAGRHDHTSDYRTQIGLSGMVPRSELLLLDDDHVFKGLAQSGQHPALLQAFLGGGLRSGAYGKAKSAIAPLRWDEMS